MIFINTPYTSDYKELPCRNEYKQVLPDLAVGVTTYLNIELVKLNSATWEKFPSGLLVALIETVGERQCGRTVIDGDQLAVEYEGSLENGTVFDSSRERGAPFGPFVQGRGQIIRGYEVALAGRCLGERFKMIVPPHLAYGDSGRTRRELLAVRIHKCNIFLATGVIYTVRKVLADFAVRD